MLSPIAITFDKNISALNFEKEARGGGCGAGSGLAALVLVLRRGDIDLEALCFVIGGALFWAGLHCGSHVPV